MFLALLQILGPIGSIFISAHVNKVGFGEMAGAIWKYSRPWDLVEFYAPDPRVAAAWAPYRFEKNVDEFAFYVRRGSAADHAGALDVDADAAGDPR